MAKKRLPFTKEIRARWRKVKAAILRDPQFYDQRAYGDGQRPRDCGSACCLAGWYAAFLPSNDPLKRSGDFLAVKRDVGLHHTITSSYGIDWPEPFATRYQRAASNKQRAKVAAARIDHLLNTGE